MTQWLRRADNSSSFSHSNCCTTSLEMSNTSDVFLLLLTIHPRRKMLCKGDKWSISPGVSAGFSIYHPIVCKAWDNKSVGSCHFPTSTSGKGFLGRTRPFVILRPSAAPPSDWVIMVFPSHFVARINLSLNSNLSYWWLSLAHLSTILIVHFSHFKLFLRDLFPWP